MAMNNDVTELRTIPPENPNWSELISKTTNDLAHIVRTEIGLLEVALTRVLGAQAEKLAGILILVTALAYGSFFLFGGIVLLIHVWLVWWAAFIITGGFVMALGMMGLLMFWTLARRKSA